jgi:tagatose 1,6-diphosphate aldolase
LLLAYEKSGYDNEVQGRLPDLLPHLSAQRIRENGGDAVKILLYFTPHDTDEVNDIKKAWLQRLGDECKGADIPLFLEPISYDPNGMDEKGTEFAKLKPQIVIDSMREFSDPKYGVDILKVEFPVNMKFVEGYAEGETVYSRQDAIDYLKEAASVAGLPFIYLTAGVSNKTFTNSLELAAEAGTPYSGVLAGRATWLDGVKIYATGGNDAFREGLSTQGVENIQAINGRLDSAQPWFKRYGVNSAEELLQQGQPVAAG